MQLNSDTGNNYSTHKLFGSGSNANTSGTSTTTRIDLGYMMNSSSEYGAMVTDLLDYTATNKAKTIRALSGTDLNGSGYINLNSGLWFKNTSSIYEVINSIKISPGAGTFAQYTQLALYGIKG